MFLYKNLFFSISSILSITIMLIGINGGYFPAIFRVCFVSSSDALFSFYICSHSKAEKVKFSELLLPLTNGICARDVISHSLKRKYLGYLRD